MKTKILLLDDEKHIRDDLSINLKRKGYEIFSSSNINEAENIIKNHSFEFAIIDLKIDAKSEYNGIKVIKSINNNNPNTKVIVLSANLKTIDQKGKDELNKVKVAALISKGGSENYIKAVINKLNSLKKI